MTSFDKAPETPEIPVQVHADHDLVKHLGNWTTAHTFDVRARRGAIVLDLRSPQIRGDIDVHLTLDHAMVKLLVPDGARIEQTAIAWTGKGRVKDYQRGEGSGERVVRLTGSIVDGEVRVHRSGVAILSAMFSRAYVEDVKRAHREGGMPTVDDPTRDPNGPAS